MNQFPKKCFCFVHFLCSFTHLSLLRCSWSRRLLVLIYLNLTSFNFETLQQFNSFLIRFLHDPSEKVLTLTSLFLCDAFIKLRPSTIFPLFVSFFGPAHNPTLTRQLLVIPRQKNISWDGQKSICARASLAFLLQLFTLSCFLFQFFTQPYWHIETSPLISDTIVYPQTSFNPNKPKILKS